MNIEGLWGNFVFDSVDIEYLPLSIIKVSNHALL
jgi:hypothetical protein